MVGASKSVSHGRLDQLPHVRLRRNIYTSSQCHWFLPDHDDCFGFTKVEIELNEPKLTQPVFYMYQLTICNVSKYKNGKQIKVISVRSHSCAN